MARLGRVLARPWGVLGASWRRLGASWRVLGASWARLSASWARLGTPFGARQRYPMGPRDVLYAIKIDQKTNRKSKPSWTPLGSEKPCKTNEKNNIFINLSWHEREARTRMTNRRALEMSKQVQENRSSIYRKEIRQESQSAVKILIAPFASLAALARSLRSLGVL